MDTLSYAAAAAARRGGTQTTSYPPTMDSQRATAAACRLQHCGMPGPPLPPDSLNMVACGCGGILMCCSSLLKPCCS